MNSQIKSGFDKKVATLLALAENSAIEYVPSQMTRKSPWKHNDNGIARPDGRFFSVRMITGRYKNTGEVYTEQPIICQEAPQYDKATCDKVTGHVVLPLKRTDEGKIEAGITFRNAGGTFGETIFTAPRGSLTNSNQVSDLKGPEPVWQRLQVADAARLTGHTDCRVVWLDAEGDVQPHTGDMNQTVWFTLDELELLVDHGKMQDSFSNGLINWVLRKRDALEAGH